MKGQKPTKAKKPVVEFEELPQLPPVKAAKPIPEPKPAKAPRAKWVDIDAIQEAINARCKDRSNIDSVRQARDDVLAEMGISLADFIAARRK